MCTARLFSQGVDLFAPKFYLQNRSSTPTILGIGKVDWLPDGEDRIPLRSLVLTQYRSVPDKQTDML